MKIKGDKPGKCPINVTFCYDPRIFICRLLFIVFYLVSLSSIFLPTTVVYSFNTQIGFFLVKEECSSINTLNSFFDLFMLLVPKHACVAAALKEVMHFSLTQLCIASCVMERNYLGIKKLSVNFIYICKYVYLCILWENSVMSLSLSFLFYEKRVIDCSKSLHKDG